MTRPISIPPPGSPLVGLGAILSEIASAAGREDAPQSGLIGSEGTITAPPPQCSIALFQLTGPFLSGSISPTWANAPGAAWYHANATRVEYYSATASPANTWNTPADQGDTATTPEIVQVWAPAALIQANLTIETKERVWCFYDEGPGAWVMMARSSIRCYGWASAAAQYVSAGGGGSLVAMDLEGSSPALLAGDGATGAMAAVIPGTYLVFAGLSVGPGLTGAGTLATPPHAAFTAAIGRNGPPLFGSSLIPDAQSHFHCLTDPAGTPNWKITVAGTDYDLPQLPSAVGNLSIAKIYSLAANDQIGLFLQSAYGMELLNAYLVMLRLGP